MASSNVDKLAVLIDADNAQYSSIDALLAEVSNYGSANIKRAYGNWTSNHLSGWKDALHTLAIQPIQQFSYTTGKNSTDSALIIDAMDLLHEGNLNGFCIVSSDSDFTRLATRIREAGLKAYGFGERKTPEAFVAACDKFIHTEILLADETEIESFDSIKPLMHSAAIMTAQDSGWSTLSALGSMLTRISPSFDPRKFGCSKLSALVRKLPYLDVQETPGTKNPAHIALSVRLKDA